MFVRARDYEEEGK